MADLKVIDDDGDWFRQSTEFRIYHHSRDHFFEPGVAYKIKPDDWIAKQTVIEKIDDPLGKPSKKGAKPE